MSRCHWFNDGAVTCAAVEPGAAHGIARSASAPAMALLGATLEGISTTAVQTLTVSDSAEVHVGNRYNIQLAADGTTGMTIKSPPARTTHRLIAFPRNEDVIDRAVFAELESLLPTSQDFQSAALWGLGGSGKTQIALEFAYRRCRDPNCSVFWVHADNEAAFAQDYESIARRLGLAETLNGEKLLAAVRMHIEADPCWVLVLDNADDLGLFGVGRQSVEQSKLGAFVPRGPAGTVLWTSRDERISGTLVGAQRAINVSRMTSAEAIALFETVRNRKMGVDEEDDIAMLLTELDWLPLAISQAAAYTRRTQTEIKTYLSKLQQGKRRWKALKESEFDRHRREHVSNSILETWRISIEYIRRENEMAYHILHILAFTDNQNIPNALVKCAATYGIEVRDAQKDVAIRDLDSSSDDDDNDEEIIGAITRLREFSFLSARASNGENQAYEMHKLVQEATRYGLSRPEKQDEEAYFSTVAVHVVSDLFPVSEANSWSECEKYVVHAQRVSEWADRCREENEAPDLLLRVSDYLYERGRWREKEAVDDRAYMLCKKVLGDRHLDTLRSMANMAMTYYQLGRYDMAEPIQLQVVAMRREILGDKHLHTIHGMSNLATTYIGLDECDKAEALTLEVLTLRRELLGYKHPDTLRSMGELVRIFYTLQRYEEAKAIIIEILALRREVLGDNHPDTIRGVSDLAAILYKLGRYNEAETMHVEVLALRREILGDKHPDTIDAMHQLSATWHTLGRYNEAERMQVKVLAQRREIFGDKHPSTVSSLHNLATTWYNQGRCDDALALMQDCLEICRHILKPDHLYTLSSQRFVESWRATDETPPMIAND